MVERGGEAVSEPPPDPRSAAELMAGVDLQAARRAIAGAALRTPTIACDELAEHAGERWR